MGINLQTLLDTALAEHDTGRQAEIDAQTAAKIKAALDADAIEDEKALKAKDDQISARNAKIADLEAKIDELNEQIEVLQARIDELEKGGTAPLPEPEPEPTPSKFPDATNSGVPNGTVLSDYTGPLTITQAGTVIDKKRIKGTLDIRAANVVVKNSELTFTGMYGFTVYAANCIIQDCTIIGPGTRGQPNSSILGYGTFLRNNCSQTGNGIVLDGKGILVKGNFIHDLNGKPDEHTDGIACHGKVEDAVIEDNTIISKVNSAVYITNDFGPNKNIKVRRNLLKNDPNRKYGFTVYSDGGKANGGLISGVEFTDNLMEAGVYGYKSFTKNSPVWSGNKDLNGKPIS